MTKPTREQVYLKVIQTLAEVAGTTPDELDENTELIKDLNLDSLALYEIVIEFEETYDLQISDNDLEQIQTVADTVDHILLALGA